jgi:hypothetical protein
MELSSTISRKMNGINGLVQQCLAVIKSVVCIRFVVKGDNLLLEYCSSEGIGSPKMKCGGIGSSFVGVSGTFSNTKFRELNVTNNTFGLFEGLSFSKEMFS